MNITAMVIKNKKPGNKFFFTASRLIDTAAPNFKLWITMSAGANQAKALAEDKQNKDSKK